MIRIYSKKKKKKEVFLSVTCIHPFQRLEVLVRDRVHSLTVSLSAFKVRLKAYYYRISFWVFYFHKTISNIGYVYLS